MVNKKRATSRQNFTNFGLLPNIDTQLKFVAQLETFCFSSTLLKQPNKAKL